MKFNLKLNNNIICIVLLLAILAGIVIIFLRQNNKCMMDEGVEGFGWRNSYKKFFAKMRRQQEQLERRIREAQRAATVDSVYKQFTQYNNSNINYRYGNIIDNQSGDIIDSLSNCIDRYDCEAVTRFSNSNTLWGSNLSMVPEYGTTTYLKN